MIFLCLLVTLEIVINLFGSGHYREEEDYVAAFVSLIFGIIWLIVLIGLLLGW